MFNKLFKFLYQRFRRVKNKAYGYVYLPNYSNRHKILEGSSNLYNEYGEKLEEYFLRDKHMRCSPYRHSRYIHFDRYNLGLKTHFYSHESMLEIQGNPDNRYGFLIESPAIVPKSYKLFDKFKGLEKDFKYIFTYDANLLEKLDNARYSPFCAGLYNSSFSEVDQYKRKTKNISILSSNKLMCDLHKFRYDLAWKCKNYKLADTYGTFDGGCMVTLTDTLRDYRFSICIENLSSPYFFTERLVAALANQTVPIYLGAQKIGEKFNPNWIIQISTKSDIDSILKECTKENYESRIDAILDNYERVKEYLNPFDYLYTHYLKN